MAEPQPRQYPYIAPPPPPPPPPPPLYAAPGYPQQYEVIFCGYESDGYTPAAGGPGGKYDKDCGARHTGGIVDQMNQIWESAGAKLRMRVLHADDLKAFGDHGQLEPEGLRGRPLRNFIRYLSDIDESSRLPRRHGAAVGPAAPERC